MGYLHEWINISVCAVQPVRAILSVDGKRAPGAVWNLKPNNCDSDGNLLDEPIYINPIFLYTLKKSDLSRFVEPDQARSATAKTTTRKFLLQMTYQVGSFSTVGFRMNYFFIKTKRGLLLDRICRYADVELGDC